MKANNVVYEATRVIFFRALMIGILFFFILIIMSPMAKADQLFIHRIDQSASPKILCRASILDYNGEPIQGLDENNFKLIEGDNEIESLELIPINHAEPINWTLVIDVGSNMDAGIFEVAKSSARNIIETGLSSRPQDQFAIVTVFGSRYRSWPYMSIKDELISRIDGLTQLQEFTDLNPVLKEVADIGAQIDTSRTAIILITNGVTPSGAADLADCITYLKEKGEPVFVIGLDESNSMAMRQLANDTGGKLLIPEDYPSINTFFINSTRRMQYQYLIQYQTRIPKEGGDGRLDITVEHEGNSVLGAKEFRLEPYQKRWLNLTMILLGVLGILVIGVGLFIYFRNREDKKVRYCINGHVLESGEVECMLCKLEDKPTKVIEPELPPISIKPIEPRPTTVVNLPPPKPFKPDERKPFGFLFINSGPHRGDFHQLNAKTTTIGRYPNYDIVLDFDDAVGRDLAKIIHNKNNFRIHDLADHNPTQINEKSIAGKSQLLKENDMILIGKTKLVFKQIDESGVKKATKTKKKAPGKTTTKLKANN